MVLSAGGGEFPIIAIPVNERTKGLFDHVTHTALQVWRQCHPPNEVRWDITKIFSFGSLKTEI
ncbi:hypothetical protein J6590_011694 [Homalodisca vitripennis]|nr:hypothetical protein J6590_011694 [Homalodisca vitripennis]